ncbi:MAG: hypothetical protein JRH11_19745 [Deltaproteobacteria bacterium]|nr:hypothetical protein [Deltaproteobacteria bacterium]
MAGLLIFGAACGDEEAASEGPAASGDQPAAAESIAGDAPAELSLEGEWVLNIPDMINMMPEERRKDMHLMWLLGRAGDPTEEELAAHGFDDDSRETVVAGRAHRVDPEAELPEGLDRGGVEMLLGLAARPVPGLDITMTVTSDSMVINAPDGAHPSSFEAGALEGDVLNFTSRDEGGTEDEAITATFDGADRVVIAAPEEPPMTFLRQGSAAAIAQAAYE